MNEKLKTILVEIPTIVLSVIIALGINEWNNQRERKNLVESVIRTIKEEVSFNRESIEKAYFYHIPLLNNLQNGTHRITTLPLKQLALQNLSVEQIQRIMTEFLEKLGAVIEQPLVVKQKDDSLFTMIYEHKIMTLRIENDTLTIFGNGNISLHSAPVQNNAWKIAQAAQIAPYLRFDLIGAMSELDQIHAEYNSTVASIIDMLYKGGNDVTPAMQDLVALERKLLEKYEDLEVMLMKKN